MTLADVQPTTGRLCAGTWNRNTGGGIADYTVCNPTNKSGTAYISASADGATSNPLPIFVHPVVTSIVLGGSSSNCTTDPADNYCPLATGKNCDQLTAPPYTANSCISQGTTAQLVARVYSGTGATQTNISCLAGHLQFSPQSGAAQSDRDRQPSIRTASPPHRCPVPRSLPPTSPMRPAPPVFFSTCPPASITALRARQPPPIPWSSVNLNTPQPLRLATDHRHQTARPSPDSRLSTSPPLPTTIPGGAAPSRPDLYQRFYSISAVCQPGIVQSLSSL